MSDAICEEIVMRIRDGTVSFKPRGRVSDDSILEIIEGPPLAYPGLGGPYMVAADSSRDPHYDYPNRVVYRNGQLFHPKGAPFNLEGLQTTHRVRVLP